MTEWEQIARMQLNELDNNVVVICNLWDRSLAWESRFLYFGTGSYESIWHEESMNSALHYFAKEENYHADSGERFSVKKWPKLSAASDSYKRGIWSSDEHMWNKHATKKRASRKAIWNLRRRNHVEKRETLTSQWTNSRRFKNIYICLLTSHSTFYYHAHAVRLIITKKRWKCWAAVSFRK